jgi:hypothetical protein
MTSRTGWERLPCCRQSQDQLDTLWQTCGQDARNGTTGRRCEVRDCLNPKARFCGSESRASGREYRPLPKIRNTRIRFNSIAYSAENCAHFPERIHLVSAHTLIHRPQNAISQMHHLCGELFETFLPPDQNLRPNI